MEKRKLMIYAQAREGVLLEIQFEFFANSHNCDISAERPLFQTCFVYANAEQRRFFLPKFTILGF